ITAVRSALASTIRDVPGLRVVENLTESANLPAAVVEFAGYETVAMSRGTVQMQFSVVVIAPLSHGRITTVTLDELVAPFGSGSIPQQIWDTKNLGLSDVNATVSQVSGYSELEGFGVEHAAC